MKLIAETAWHHDGDFDFFKDLVENLVVKTKADFIKFHISLDADEYIHTDHPAYDWVVERIFTASQWTEIINYTIENGKKPMLLFNDKKAIEFGMQFCPELVEIHSVCLNDINLLNFLKEKIDATTNVVLGVGGSTLYEIENAINILETRNIVLMHGFQNFPTNYEDINLGKIKKIMQLYPEYEHGYADHTAWDNEHNVLITLFGASLEMDYIEKHVSIVTGKGRTDWQAAISIDLFNELTAKLEILSKTFGNKLLRLNDGERAYAVFGPNKKAGFMSKVIKQGEILAENHLCFKRTGQSSTSSQIDILNLVGKKAKISLAKDSMINPNNFE